MALCFSIIAVLSEGIRTAFVSANFFYSPSNLIIIFFHTFAFNWKNSLENVQESALHRIKHATKVYLFINRLLKGLFFQYSLKVHDCFIVYQADSLP